MKEQLALQTQRITHYVSHITYSSGRFFTWEGEKRKGLRAVALYTHFAVSVGQSLFFPFFLDCFLLSKCDMIQSVFGKERAVPYVTLRWIVY